VEYKVIWTKEALSDIEDIANYIEKTSFYYASSVVNKIVSITKKLSLFPYSGRKIPEEKSEKVREYFVYSYRVIYEIEDKNVFILAIIHGKRLLDNKFLDR
jgi:addiction module RelE/StbE family toxin